MRAVALIVILVTSAITEYAATPRLVSLRVSWAPYPIPQSASNVVIVLYKSTSLGTIWSPFKPTAYWPATRTNGSVSVLSGNTYRFYATVQGKPLPESAPSNTVTNKVAP